MVVHGRDLPARYVFRELREQKAALGNIAVENQGLGGNGAARTLHCQSALYEELQEDNIAYHRILQHQRSDPFGPSFPIARVGRAALAAWAFHTGRRARSRSIYRVSLCVDPCGGTSTLNFEDKRKHAKKLSSIGI